jgi:hypothetical protein
MVNMISNVKLVLEQHVTLFSKLPLIRSVLNDGIHESKEERIWQEGV